MDQKIKELLTRLSFFAADGMGEEKLVEFAKQADALLMEVARKPNTHQPVAWIERYVGGGVAYDKYSDAVINLPEGVKIELYTAPPVQRDVLMAALIEVCGWIDANDPWPDLNDIADRYASKVQPDPVTKQDTSELQPEGSDLEGLDLSHIPSDQLEALAKIYRISGIPLIHTGELEDKTMTAEEVFSMNVKWLEDVLADVTNINFPIHGEKHE